MKVRIDAGGRMVEIECADTNVSVDEISDKALTLWDSTSAAGGTEGPGYGFTPQLAASPKSRYLDTQPLQVVSEEEGRANS